MSHGDDCDARALEVFVHGTRGAERASERRGVRRFAGAPGGFLGGLLLATLVALCLPSCSGSGPPSELQVLVEEPVVLELLPYALPVVRVELAGRGELEFVVDTGAESSVIFRPWAVELGLPLLPFEGTMTGSNGVTVQVTEWTYARAIDLGSARIENLALIVSVADVGEPSWGGILGQDVLAKLTTIFDGERQSLHLLPRGWGQESIESYLSEQRIGPGKWVIVGLEFKPRPFLELDTGEDQYDVLIDTGATATSFPIAALRAIGREQIDESTSFGVSGERVGGVYELEGVQLFGLRMSGTFHDTELPYGLLGMSVLGTLVLIHDPPNGKLWLHKRAAEVEGEGD